MGIHGTLRTYRAKKSCCTSYLHPLPTIISSNLATLNRSPMFPAFSRVPTLCTRLYDIVTLPHAKCINKNSILYYNVLSYIYIRSMKSSATEGAGGCCNTCDLRSRQQMLPVAIRNIRRAIYVTTNSSKQAALHVQVLIVTNYGQERVAAFPRGQPCVPATKGSCAAILSAEQHLRDEGNGRNSVPPACPCDGG